MNLLALIPARVYEYGLVVLACALIAIGFIRHERELGVQHERQAVQQAAAKASAAAASETQRREVAIQEVIHATQQAASQVAADASVAARERDVLRMQLDAYVRRSAVSRSASAPAGSASALDPDILLAGLLNAAWDRSQELAAEADRRGVAGRACEGYADALNVRR